MSDPAGSPSESQAHVSSARRSVRRSLLVSRAPGRLVLAAFLVVAAVGLRTIFLGTSPAPVRAAAGDPIDPPSEDLALRFTRAYLTFDAADPRAREDALRPYLPAGIAADGGFEASRGSRRVLWEDVASDQRALQGGRVITIAADVSGLSTPLFLAVTIRHESGQPLSVVGYPSLVGAPAVASNASEAARQSVSERPVIEVVERVLGNYLAGSVRELRADLTADADVTLPTVALREQELKSIDWIGRAGSGAVLATVVAAASEGETYTLTYELGISWHERPYVDFIEVVPTES
jgi:hypothetical protein